MWTYLTDFWNAITDTIVGGVNYTASWFQQIGNAVAGAIAYIFLLPLRLVIELGLAVAYIGKIILGLLVFLLSPVYFIFGFAYYFFSYLDFTPDYSGSEVWAVDNSVIVFFNSFPYWSLLAGSIFGLIALFVALKLFKHLKA